jgi:hypothetical protein
MPNQRIRGNQITDQRTIIQNEHEEKADAKRVLVVDQDGNPITSSNPLPTTAVIQGNVIIDGLSIEDSVTGDSAQVDGARRLRTHDAELKSAIDAVLAELQNPSELATEGTLQTVVSRLVDVLNALNATLEIRDIQATRDNILVAGTENGQANGTLRYFVNNLRKQILDSADRERSVVWADFSNKRLRRVIRFDYTSPTFPSVTARKVFNYTLVGNEYRFDGDAWSIVI